MSPIHKSDWLLAGECAETEGTHVRLEAAEQVTEERVLDAEGQGLPLNHRALDVVVLQHRVLPQGLDCEVVLGGAQFSE